MYQRIILLVALTFIGAFIVSASITGQRIGFSNSESLEVLAERNEVFLICEKGPGRSCLTGEKVSPMVYIENRSRSRVKLKSASGSCGCTRLTAEGKLDMLPGDRIRLRVEIDTRGRVNREGFQLETELQAEDGESFELNGIVSVNIFRGVFTIPNQIEIIHSGSTSITEIPIYTDVPDRISLDSLLVSATTGLQVKLDTPSDGGSAYKTQGSEDATGSLNSRCGVLRIETEEFDSGELRSGRVDLLSNLRTEPFSIPVTIRPQTNSRLIWSPKAISFSESEVGKSSRKLVVRLNSPSEQSPQLVRLHLPDGWSSELEIKLPLMIYRIFRSTPMLPRGTLSEGNTTRDDTTKDEAILEYDRERIGVVPLFVRSDPGNQ